MRISAAVTGVFLAFATLCSPLLCSPLLAFQEDYVFTIEENPSSFTWGGSFDLDLGIQSYSDLPIVQEPDEFFGLQGTTNLRFWSGGTPISAGEFTGASAHAILGTCSTGPCDLTGYVRNPNIPALRLACFTIEDVDFTIVSTSDFVVQPDGAFQANVVLTANNGTISYDIKGIITGSDFLNQGMSDPTAVTGTVIQTSSGTTLSFSLNTIVHFQDQSIAGGAATLGGDLTINGTFLADGCVLPLAAQPSTVMTGENLDFTTSCGVPSSPAFLVVTGINDTPTFFLTPARGSFNASGIWGIGGTVTSSPLVPVDFRVLSIGPNGTIIQSNDERVVFQ